MAELTPGAHVRRAFLPEPLYGEVITYNGAVRVLRDDGQMEDPVGWYPVDLPGPVSAPDRADDNAVPVIDDDDDDDDGPCWCGEQDPLYLKDGLEKTCGGFGVLCCRCGGDLCICHHHGEVVCHGCVDCDYWDDDDDGFEDDD